MGRHGGHHPVGRHDLLQRVEHAPAHLGVQVVVALEEPLEGGRVGEPPQGDRRLAPEQRRRIPQVRRHARRGGVVTDLAERLDREVHELDVVAREEPLQGGASRSVADLTEREGGLPPDLPVGVAEERQEVLHRGRILKPPGRPHRA